MANGNPSVTLGDSKRLSVDDQAILRTWRDTEVPTKHRDLRRILARIHKALRDTDGNSSIVERFDETTKLLFLKLLSERGRGRKDSFRWQSTDTSATCAARLRTGFSSAVMERPSLFPGRFRHLVLSDEALAAVGRILQDVELARSNQDIKGHAYEEMIRNTFDKGGHQQFFTPQPVVDFLVSVMEPVLRGDVCDPACGTGGFLVEVVKRALPVRTITGLEIDDRLAWVTGMNLFVHDAPEFEARYVPDGGTLGRHGRRLAARFDAIITNPPFGSDFSDADELGAFVLGRGRPSRRRGILSAGRIGPPLQGTG